MSDNNKACIVIFVPVIPNEFQNSFEIDRKSGVISVKTALDKEGIEQIAVFIQVAEVSEDIHENH